MVNTIIFDFGKVLVNWDDDLGHYLPAQAAKEVEAAVFGSGCWQELDRGVLDEDEVIAQMYANAPRYARQISYVLENLGMLATRCDYAIPWIAQLKCAGYKIYYLSNYSKLLRNSVPYVLNFLPYLDGGMFSYEEHLLKPDPEFYQRLISKYDLVPEECLFIDDRPENIAAAAALGMETHLFENYDKSYPEIMNRLF